MQHASKLYAVPLIDYDRQGANGLLVASGSGIMMGVMDAAPALRWCVDIDGLKPSANLAEFLIMAEQLATPIAVTGWFSITDPTRLREAVRSMTIPPWLYGGNVRFDVGRECQSLAELISEVNTCSRSERQGQGQQGESRSQIAAALGGCQDNSDVTRKEPCQVVTSKGGNFGNG